MLAMMLAAQQRHDQRRQRGGRQPLKYTSDSDDDSRRPASDSDENTDDDVVNEESMSSNLDLSGEANDDALRDLKKEKEEEHWDPMMAVAKFFGMEPQQDQQQEGNIYGNLIRGKSCKKNLEGSIFDLSFQMEDGDFEEDPPVPTIPVLMEIVSATGLVSDWKLSVDPYCVVRMKQASQLSSARKNGRRRKKRRGSRAEVVHRTSRIDNDPDPIWTIKTKSLCLLEIPESYASSAAALDPRDGESINVNGTSGNGASRPPLPAFQIEGDDDEEANDPEAGKVIVEVCHGRVCLGVVAVPFEDVLNKMGDREEYLIRTTLQDAVADAKAKAAAASAAAAAGAGAEGSNGKKDDKNKNKTDRENTPKNADVKGTLALRFKRASPQEVEFMCPETLAAAAAAPLQAKKNKSSLFERRRSSRQMQLDAERTTDLDFKMVQNKKAFTQYCKLDKDNKTKLHRVQPYPDPKRVEETRWMTKSAIQAEALKPSEKWMEAGYGSLGKVYVEILGCNDLPNMDAGGAIVGDLTDAFVAVVMEDSMLRTRIIHDSLNPRWMPWTNRAFCFHVSHPSSLLMVGVFDYDALPLDGTHDPIGRVVINLANFRPDTSYLLHYQLHDDPLQQDDDRGTLIIRLRFEWMTSEADAIRASYQAPPRFMINVETNKSLQVLRYICRGKVNMEKASMDTVKMYAKEMMDYIRLYCYILDVLVSIWLWRGRLQLPVPSWLWYLTDKINRRIGGGGRHDEKKTKTEGVEEKTTATETATTQKIWDVWFPWHSVVIFMAANVCVERPELIPAVFFYGLAYIMLTLNYHASRHPSPWHRCKSWTETAGVLWGSSSSLSSTSTTPPSEERHEGRPTPTPQQREESRRKSTIVAHEGAEEAAALAALDRVKTQRSSSFLWDLKTVGLQVRRTYKKTNMEYHNIETEDNEWFFLGNQLYYVHFLLYMLCTYIRMFRNLCNWKGYNSYKVTMMFLTLGTVWWVVPARFSLLWTSRLFVWVVLGPGMKLIDRWYIHRHFRTREELMEDPVYHGSTLPDMILNSEKLRQMGKSGRVAAENALKLKDMREYQFGKLSMVIPPTDTSRFPYIPLPESSAVPYLGPPAFDNGDEQDDVNSIAPMRRSTTKTTSRTKVVQEGFVDIPPQEQTWKYVAGQKLQGNMIHARMQAQRVRDLSHARTNSTLSSSSDDVEEFMSK